MWGYDGVCYGFGWWWIIPIAMILMFVLCFLMMRGRMGCITCGPFFRSFGDLFRDSRSETAMEILDKRYAGGEIGKAEYEEKKRDLERNPSR
jgi:putative membrane protein